MVRSTNRRRQFGTVLAAVLVLTTLVGCSAAGGDDDASNATAPNQQPFGPNAGPGGDDDAGVAGTGRTPGGGPSEVDTVRQPLSTFAVDVDTASYGYAQRLLGEGRRPNASTVRPEEFVNAFRQDYPQPEGNGFGISTDGSRLPDTHDATGAGAVRLMRVGLQTRQESATARPDANLTFVVDVSGSMAETGKLDLAQDALRTLADQLRPTDRVAIVSYSETARLVQPMTPARERSTVKASVDKLRTAGSTNLEAGLVLGYRVARENFRAGATNRVILLSDGLPNVGSTSAEPILSQVRENAAKQIALLGVGVGSDYGDAFMEQLADKGDGFVVYVSSPGQARRVFVEQLPATLAVRALDAKAQVEFDPSVVASYRLIGYDNRALAASDFRRDNVDGGEVGPGHAVTALYTVRLRTDASGSSRAATVRVRWQDPVSREPGESSDTVRVGDLDGGFGAASPRLQVCYAAAYFAEVLRASQYGREVRTADLAGIASAAASATEDEDVSRLAELIGRL